MPSRPENNINHPLKNPMGLTIHYQLQHAGTVRTARSLVQQLHRAAQDLPFKKVSAITELAGEACDFKKRETEDPLRWMLIQCEGDVRLDEHSWLSVPASRMIAFEAWPGDGCEVANIGLCQYPGTVEHQGKRKRTHLGGWRWSSFCKTQYASDPQFGGVPNFIRCHLSVIALLDQAKALGCLAEVSDEGDFWEQRDVQALVPEIESWNGMLAAFAGQLKDALGDGVQAPITEYPNFEHLEQAGLAELPPESAQLAKLIQQVVKRP